MRRSNKTLMMAATAMLMLAGPGCSSDPDPGPTTEGCTEASCAPYTCGEGACFARCESEDQCAVGAVCVAGACEAGDVGVDTPDVAEPDVAEPDVAEPDVSEPDVAEPDVVEPDVSDVPDTAPDVVPDVDAGSDADTEVEPPDEICDNGFDDDRDLDIDCDDSDCEEDPACQPEETCGDGSFDPEDELCDAGMGCSDGQVCTATCECRDTECGDGIAEGAESCDGDDIGTCGDDELCVECGCIEDGPPELDDLPDELREDEDPLLELHPWRTDDACPFPGPLHGFTIELSGTSASPIASVVFPDLNGERVEVEVEGVAAGEFSFDVTVCSDALPEETTLSTLLVDESDRESNTIEWDFPLLANLTLSQVDIFGGRDPGYQVLRVTGTAPDRNIRTFVSDIFNAEGGTLATGLVSGPTALPLFMEDGTFNATTYFFGAAEATSYSTRVTTLGGLLSGSVDATPTPPAELDEACMPAVTAVVAVCADGLVCGETTDPYHGACLEPSGAAPVLTGIDDPQLRVGSPLCEDETYPNRISMTLLGNSAEAITKLRVFDDVLEAGEADIIVGARASGEVELEFITCIGWIPDTMGFAFIDEGGRVSNTLEVTF